MSMSTPARIALRAASAPSLAMPWPSSSWMPAQSDVTKPSKPHWLRSTSVRSQGLAVDGTPLRALKAAMKLAEPAFTAARKGGR
jgi:hypothetical protein